MSDKSTLISQLDKIELQNTPPPLESSPKVDTDVPSDTDTKDDAPLPKSEWYTSSDIALLVLLLFAFHPGINSYINTLLRLGGFTFIAKSLLVVIIYIIIRRYFLV